MTLEAFNEKMIEKDELHDLLITILNDFQESHEVWDRMNEPCDFCINIARAKELLHYSVTHQHKR